MTEPCTIGAGMKCHRVRSRLLGSAAMLVVLGGAASARAAVTLELVTHLPSPARNHAMEGMNGVAMVHRVELAEGPFSLLTLSLDDPAYPEYHAERATSNWTYAMAADNDYIYLPIAQSLRVFDASQPENLVEVANIAVPRGAPWRATADGNRLYWTHQPYGVMLADISQPTAPVLHPTLYTGCGIAGIAADGDRLLVGQTTGGLLIYDVSDLDAPTQLGYLDLPGYTSSIAVAGDIAYLAGDSAGLHIVDISDPTDPVVIGQCPYPGSYAVDLQRVGRYLVMALEVGGIAVVDVADPENPVCHPARTVPGLGWDVHTAGNHVIVATFFQGVASYRIRGAIGACCSGDECWETVDDGCVAPLRGEGTICDAYELAPPTFNGCWGDADGSGHVSPADRGYVSANLGTREADTLCMYDLDGNGVVNAEDRLTISRNVGQCLPLPDYQDGSGMNQGTSDLRFRPEQQYMGFATTCGEVNCGGE